MSSVEVIDGCTESVAEFMHVVVEFIEMIAELENALLNVFGLLFDLERAEALEDGLEIGDEGGGRDDDDAFLFEGIINEVASVDVAIADFGNKHVVI